MGQRVVSTSPEYGFHTSFNENYNQVCQNSATVFLQTIRVGNEKCAACGAPFRHSQQRFTVDSGRSASSQDSCQLYLI